MNIGIIGSGLIVQVALDIYERIDDVKCTAMYCRSVDKESAQEVVNKYKIDNLYDNIDQFLEDSSYGTIYIGVINSTHYEFAKKALLANKHVICEKPFTSTYAEAKELAELAKQQNRMLFGAVRLRTLKNFEEIKNTIPSLGDIKMMQCNYSQYSRRYDKYLEHVVLPAFDPELSGGCLYDINVYNVHFVVSLFGKPETVQYYPNKGYNGIDTSGILILDYGTFKAVCCAAKDSASPAYVTMQGTKGYIEVRSMPAQVANVNVVLGDKQYGIDLDEIDDAMESEFRSLFEIIKEKDYARMETYLNDTLIAMKVLDDGRKSANLEFAADRK
ncbi:Gfo/Idh/MocA family protein [Breznakia pachnodae]|uniref:Dehydrogenase n=1 Tax=Breznakia pachnodae TaxID=265178 RepID=A0ABU0E839_9FIRM|nr:Gfo/Idh/MocA family oxidoreductase [Breznakia pachnodae]MDQ0363062.1 putative dehydrogenase [Breznakia pachnodae]